jgi:hypothetical protein
MMASIEPLALASQIASEIRWLSVLDACPAFPQIQEKLASDRGPAGHDMAVVPFFL